MNSKIDKVRKWGIIDDPDAYRNPRNTLTHELLHSLTLRHSLVSEIMLNGTNFNKVVPVKVGYNDVNGLIAIYNGPKIIEPDTLKTSSKDSIIVIKGQKINFKVLPNNDTTPAYPYTASIYNVKPNNTYTSYGKMTLINGDSIKYSWDTTEMERDTMNIEFYMKGAEYIGKSIFQDIAGNQVVYLSCNQRPSKRRFSVCDYLVYEPKADTAIVAKAGNFIPVSLRISDLNSAISKLDGVYNIDSLRVQYVLWNDGFAWLNDSISTSPSIDPRKEFKWYFAQFDSDTTINMNHPDLEVNADYFIKAHLYQKDGENLTYIGTAESGNFDIMPEVMIWIDPTVSENEVFRSTDTTHLITAVCLEPDGTNYGFWGMDYYYKFDDESVWTKFGDHKKEKEEIQVDTCTWNCGTKKGYGWLKAVADLTHEISFHYGIV
ncbi:MAG: hypothetical protein RBS89_02805 [Candidatus Delongbacteria bacterium]|nr:hypothetical protein [Candidatus Delongbacteria bacterium]